MGEKRLSRAELEAATRDFTNAFNEEDLDKVMSWFAEDGVYDEFNGVRSTGKAEIRKTFEPQFAGEFGEMRFIDDDLFVDEESQKSMVSWECTLRKGDRYGGWRGLDLLHFRDGKVVQKLTYAKTERPLLVKKT
jgi:uncharacterized protein (TIGR02246 family)